MMKTTTLTTTMHKMKAQIRQMPKCGSRVGEKQEKSIELSLGVLIAILNLCRNYNDCKNQKKKEVV